VVKRTCDRMEGFEELRYFEFFVDFSTITFPQKIAKLLGGRERSILSLADMERRAS